MSAVVTAHELVDYMSGIRVPPGSIDAVQGIIDATQGELEGWLGYPLVGDPVDGELSYVRDLIDGVLFTAQWPVATVQSITDSAGDTPTHRWDSTGDLIIVSDTYDANGYTISYTPGLPPAMLNVAKNLIKRVAAREVTNKHDDTRSDRDTFGRPIAPVPEGWQRGEKRQFSRFRHREAVYSRRRTAGPGVLPAPDQPNPYGPEYLGSGRVVL